MDNNNVLSCAFCNKKKAEVDILITGANSNICDACVNKANQIVEQEKISRRKSSNINKFKNLKPLEIHKYLDKYIIGQEVTKKVLSVAVYNHYKRIDNEYEGVELDKSNILIIGETGTGKTLFARTIAKMLNVPFCIVDATSLTEAGYVGEDVETILTRLLQVADYDTASAEKGIIFIDEIDKISRKNDNPSITRDVSGEGVQQALLKLIEGDVVNVPPQGGRKHPDQKYIQVNTKNILFMCGGAFAGISEIIKDRVKKKRLGFSSKNIKLKSNCDTSNILPTDIKKYGIIPELIGRLPIISRLSPLTEEMLYQILTQPKNAIIKQYELLFAMDDIKLSISDSVYRHIVKLAVDFKLGARGLRSICEKLFLDDLYSLPSNNKKKILKVDIKYAKNKLKDFNFNEFRSAS